MTDVLTFPGVVGDGRNDDTAGIQAALDSRAATLYLPAPPKCYSIARPLRLHSGQTFMADRNAVIRLADHAHAHMLTNADPASGNQGITVMGGIWDGNNAHQTCDYHQGIHWRAPYDPNRYLGVVMQFNRVTDLHVAGLTLKDPETFGFQAGNLLRFTIEDITFDYNMLRLTTDGIHIHGNSRLGRIANLKGATNDDLVALNADDGSMYEISRGPIEDIVVDGIWAEDGYTAVRLLSAGSPIRRVKLSNLFGTYRYNIVSLTNHKVHPGEPSLFEDISVDGVFCSKSPKAPPAADGGEIWSGLSQVWIDAPAEVSSLFIRDYHRTESSLPSDDLHIEPGARVEHLALSDMRLTNACRGPICFLHNRGTVGSLSLSNIHATSPQGLPDGYRVRNTGAIGSLHQGPVTGLCGDLKQEATR